VAGIQKDFARRGFPKNISGAARRDQTAPYALHAVGKPKAIENRGRDIEKTCRLVHAIVRGAPQRAGPMYDKRDTQRALIGEIPMCALAVVVQALP
jgi:hypothetical protein